jgi:cell division protein FtsZ
VVATGLGSQAVRAPLQVIDNKRQAERQALDMGEPDYNELDKPPAIRRARRAAGGDMAAAEAASKADGDYFDIPAFLRRQAD